MGNRKSMYFRLLSGIASLAFASIAGADATKGELFFTTFAGGTNVNKVSYSYDGAGGFTLGPVVNIASTPGADGIIFAPDGDLLVGGQGSGLIHKVNPVTGAFTSALTSQVGVYHLSLDPSGKSVWSTAIPGPYVANNSLSPFGPLGSSKGVTNAAGAPAFVTGLAFAAGKVFYTSGSPHTAGDFGTITLGGATAVVTPLFSTPAAHGIILDPYTGDLMLFDGNTIQQIDPVTATIKATLTIPGVDFDQGSADGNGHLFVASNLSQLEFIDYRATGLISTATFSTNEPLAANLDDIAPLAGLGAPVPLPAAIYTLPLGVGLIAIYRRRLRRAAGH